MSTHESATRSRTRNAIIDAAIDLLAGDATATLGDIANHAHVGRSTVHRYFPERSDLLRAVAQEVLTRVDQTVTRSQSEAGPFLDRLRRTVDGLLDHGPIVMFAYRDATILSDTELAGLWESGDEAVVRFFERADAPLRFPVSPRWASSVFWALLYSGWEIAESGTMTRSEVVDAIMNTFTDGLLQRPVQG